MLRPRNAELLKRNRSRIGSTCLSTCRRPSNTNSAGSAAYCFMLILLDQSVHRMRRCRLASRHPPNAERTAQYQDVVSVRRALQQAQFEKVHRLRNAGMNASQIVRETAISRKRVDKWLRLAELPERNKMEPKMNSPAFFQDYLARRWAAGCHHAKTLLAELRTRGYTGCFSVLY